VDSHPGRQTQTFSQYYLHSYTMLQEDSEVKYSYKTDFFSIYFFTAGRYYACV